jgi:hypothetical protein
MHLTLTVPRTELIDALKAKRDDIASQYDTKLNEIAETTNNPNGQLWSSYHASLAEGLSNGTLSVTADGRLDGKDVPKPPVVNHQAQADHERSVRKTQWLESEKKHSLAQFDDVLPLLEMSTDKTVPVNSAEYNRLMNQRVSSFPEVRRALPCITW